MQVNSLGEESSASVVCIITQSNTHTTDATVWLWSHSIHANFRNCSLFYGQSFGKHLCLIVDAILQDLSLKATTVCLLIEQPLLHIISFTAWILQLLLQKLGVLFNSTRGVMSYWYEPPECSPLGQTSFHCISYHLLTTQTIQVLLSNGIFSSSEPRIGHQVLY